MRTRRFQLGSMCAVVALVAVTSATSPASATLINGDFETGDLSGWSTFETPNGTPGPIHPRAIPFDTDGDGTPSFSAELSVGQLVAAANRAGGGLFQEVDLLAGDLSISVNVAASAVDFNASAGVFDLLFDGAVIDTLDLGSIQASTTKLGQLSGSIADVTAGSHEVRLRVSRPFRASANVRQYVDDFSLSGAAVPEPGTALLVATGLGLTGAIRRSRRARGPLQAAPVTASRTHARAASRSRKTRNEVSSSSRKASNIRAMPKSTSRAVRKAIRRGGGDG